MSDGVSAAGPAELERILERGIDSMRSMKEALLDERDALERRDPKRLAELARAKDVLAQELLVVDRHKSELLALAERVQDEIGSRLPGRWQEFKALIRDCSQLNRVNGTIIRSRHQQVMDGLAALRGGNAAEDTYTPSGTTGASAGRRPLTEA